MMNSMQWRFLIPGILVVFFYWAGTPVLFADRLNFVSDLISTSIPGDGVNHTFKFTTVNPVPPGGKIRFSFPEQFTVPPGLDFGDIDFAVAAVPNVYVERTLAAAASPTEDGVSIVTDDGYHTIVVTLNSTTGIGAGVGVRLKMGLHTTEGGVGDTQLVNPTIKRGYLLPVATYDASDVEIDDRHAAVAILDPVTVGPVDTIDSTPPVIVGEPQGLLPGGTTQVEISITTDEITLCAYATSSGIAYESMPNSFGATFQTNHRKVITGLTNQSTTTLYIRCRDYQNNPNPDDYILQFIIGVVPTDPDAILNPGPFPDPTNPTGNPNIETKGTSPNPGGGGSSGGDSLHLAGAMISGYGPPGSLITLLKDGVTVGRDTAGGDGAWSGVFEDMDRGTYTFGAYATDARNLMTRTYSATITLRSNTVNSISGVLLAPTVAAPATSITPGSEVVISGATAPNALVSVALRPRGSRAPSATRTATSTSFGNGIYQSTLQTAGLPTGVYEIVSRSELPALGLQSDEAIVNIGIGVELTPAETTTNAKGADLNGDGKVDLVDFSILIFNWNTTNVVADINKDGTVNLTDFSILIFNWTG